MIYCKPPFGGPEAVLEYLGRYTHRVAISNSRLLRVEGDQVVFTWRDYAHGSRMKQMSLSAEEIIRRFLLHVLPEGFVRIRYYGLLACRNREKELSLCRQILGQAEPVAPALERPDWKDLERLTGKDPLLCPGCGTGQLRLIEELAPGSAGARRDRAPP